MFGMQVAIGTGRNVTMTPAEILAHVRKLIEEHAAGDPDKWWYANRFVFARLMLDERKTKVNVKKALLERKMPCHFCGKAFDSGKGIPLHRLEEDRGYSKDNCVLAHQECHERHHAEQGRDNASSPESQGNDARVLTKHSKRYEGSFHYWWDIPPALAEAIDQYEAVEFVRDDTGASCLVPVPALKPLLTPERQTGRGAGNWGIRVRKNREDEIAIEPGTARSEWAYLPVVWTQGELATQGDGTSVVAPQERQEGQRAERRRTSPGPRRRRPDATGVLPKHSKRYEGYFYYWWDIWPTLADALDQYENVEFICDDTKASCLVPVSVLKPLLTEERQTTRGSGNWGFKVRKDREGEIAIEPGTGRSDWTYLPVVWMQEDAEG